MATVDIQDDHVDVGIEGLDRIWAMRDHLRIPAGHVTDAANAEDEARRWLHGIRLGGMHIPGVCAGTFWSQGEWVFWDVRDPAKAITVRLQGEPYDRLVVDVDDPAATLDRLKALPPADDPASVSTPWRWTTLAPVVVALAIGVAIAIALTLVELLA